MLLRRQFVESHFGLMLDSGYEWRGDYNVRTRGMSGGGIRVTGVLLLKRGQIHVTLARG